MPRGEGAPQSVVEPLQSEQDAGIPKRQILRRRREFYYGENDPLIRDPAAEAVTDWRLYNEWYDTHKVRMPYFPAPARRKRRP